MNSEINRVTNTKVSAAAADHSAHESEVFTGDALSRFGSSSWRRERPARCVLVSLDRDEAADELVG